MIVLAYAKQNTVSQTRCGVFIKNAKVLFISAMAALLVIVIALAGEPAFAAEKSYTSLSASGSDA